MKIIIKCITAIMLCIPSSVYADQLKWSVPDFVKEKLHYKLTYEEYDGKIEKASGKALLDLADNLGLTNPKKSFGCYMSRGNVVFKKYLSKDSKKPPEYNTTDLKRLGMCSIIYDELKRRYGDEITF